MKQENIVMDKAKPFILEDGGLSLGPITIRLAKNEQEIDAAQALRYRVFYEEQGATPIKDMAARKRDYDDFDDDFGDDLDETGAEQSLQGSISDSDDDVFEESDASYDYAPVAKEEIASTENSPKSIDELLERAQKAKKSGDTDMAIQYFSDILDLDPTSSLMMVHQPKG